MEYNKKIEKKFAKNREILALFTIFQRNIPLHIFVITIGS